MFSQHHLFKLQIQPWAVSGSDLSLSKATCVTLGLNTPEVTIDVTSAIDPHTSCLQTHIWFVTPLNCDLRPDIIMPTYWNIILSADMAPDMFVGLDRGRSIAQVFYRTPLLNSSCHDFEKIDETRTVDEGRRMHSNVDTYDGKIHLYYTVTYLGYLLFH